MNPRSHHRTTYRLTESDFGEREYNKAHIPGAYFFDLNRDLAGKVDVEGGSMHEMEAKQQATTL